MNKKFLMPILTLFLIGGVLALYVFATFNFTFGVFESVSAEYRATNQNTNCSTVSSFLYTAVPTSSVALSSVEPADSKRICLKVSGGGNNPVNIVLGTSGVGWNSSLIKSYSVKNPSPITFLNSPVYGWVDYNISGDANPSAVFNGSITIGRE